MQTNTLKPGQWYHVAFTLNNTTRSVSIWVNNRLVKTLDNVDASIPTGKAYLGRDTDSTFDGLVDNVIMFERDVTSEELELLMRDDNTHTFVRTNLEHYFVLGSTHNQAYDIANSIDGTDLNGTISGNVIVDNGIHSLRQAFPISSSLRFDGSEATNIVFNSDFDSTECSIGAWIKPDADANGTILSKAGSFQLNLKDGRTLDCPVMNASTNTAHYEVLNEFLFDTKFNNGALRVPETASARAFVTTNNGNMCIDKEFTISLWVKVDDDSVDRTILTGLGLYTNDTNSGLHIRDGCIRLVDSVGNKLVDVLGITVNTWYHVVITDEALYVNTYRYDFISKPIWNNNDDIIIGNNQSYTKPLFGYLDEIIFLSKRLTFRNIHDLFYGIQLDSSFDMFVVAHYQFGDDQDGKSDSSANQYTLTFSSVTHDKTTVPYSYYRYRIPCKGADGLVRTHYEFKNDSLNDSSGRKDATAAQGVGLTYIPAFNNITDRAVQFDGVQSQIICPEHVVEELGESTINTWIKLPDALDANSRYPICSQDGVFALYLQTDNDLNLKTKLFIIPDVRLHVISAQWEETKAIIKFSIIAIENSRFIRSLLTTESSPSHELLSNNLQTMMVVESSKEENIYTITLDTVVDAAGKSYPLQHVNNAYLHLFAQGVVYDTSSMINDYRIMKKTSTYPYITAGPVFVNDSITYLHVVSDDSNFTPDPNTLTGTNSYARLVDEDEYTNVMRYTHGTFHTIPFQVNAAESPDADFAFDIVFKQVYTSTDRHSVFKLRTNPSTNDGILMYVDQSDYWRIQVLYGSEYLMTKNLNGSSENVMIPAYDEWARMTFVINRTAKTLKVYYNGAPLKMDSEHGPENFVNENTITLPDEIFVDPATDSIQKYLLELGYGGHGASGDPLYIASCKLIWNKSATSESIDGALFHQASFVEDGPNYSSFLESQETFSYPPTNHVLGFGRYSSYKSSVGVQSFQTEPTGNRFFENFIVKNAYQSEYVMLLETSNGWYGLGYNNTYQLGFNHTQARETFGIHYSANYLTSLKSISWLDNYSIQKIKVWGDCLVFLTSDNELYGCGTAPTNGNLFGTGSNKTLQTVTRLLPEITVKDFSHHGSHMIVLTTDNKLMTSGDNAQGQLGMGNTTHLNTFSQVATEITDEHTIDYVMTTNHYVSAFFTTSKHAFACGWAYENSFNSTTANFYSFVELKFPDSRPIKKFFVTPIRTWLVDERNDVYVSGPYYESNGFPAGVHKGGKTTEPTRVYDEINDGSEVIDILAETTTFTYIHRERGVYSMGTNNNGQLANGNTENTPGGKVHFVGKDHIQLHWISVSNDNVLFGYRDQDSMIPFMGPIDTLSDVQKADYESAINYQLIGDLYYSDENNANNAGGSRIPEGSPKYEFMHMINQIPDGGPYEFRLSNGDVVLMSSHDDSGIHLFQNMNSNSETPWISQGRYNGQTIFGKKLPDVGHRYSGALLYELKAPSRETNFLSLMSFQLKGRYHYGTAFKGEIFIFYRTTSEGYQNFVYHGSILQPNAIGDYAIQDMILNAPTKPSNAFLFVFVAEPNTGWNDILRIKMKFINILPNQNNLPHTIANIDNISYDESTSKYKAEIQGSVFSDQSALKTYFVGIFDDSFGIIKYNTKQQHDLFMNSAPNDAFFMYTGINIPVNVVHAFNHTLDHCFFKLEDGTISIQPLQQNTSYAVRVIAIDMKENYSSSMDITIPTNKNLLEHHVRMPPAVTYTQTNTMRVVHPFKNDLFIETFLNDKDGQWNLYVGIFGANGYEISSVKLPTYADNHNNSLGITLHTSFARLSDASNNFVMCEQYHRDSVQSIRLHLFHYQHGALTRVSEHTYTEELQNSTSVNEIAAIQEQAPTLREQNIFAVVTSSTQTLEITYINVDNNSFTLEDKLSTNITWSPGKNLRAHGRPWPMTFAGRKGFFWAGRGNNTEYGASFYEAVEGSTTLVRHSGVTGKGSGYNTRAGAQLYFANLDLFIIINKSEHHHDMNYHGIWARSYRMNTDSTPTFMREQALMTSGSAFHGDTGIGWDGSEIWCNNGVTSSFDNAPGMLMTNDANVFLIITNNFRIRKIRIRVPSYELTISPDYYDIKSDNLDFVHYNTGYQNINILMNTAKTHVIISGYNTSYTKKLYHYIPITDIPDPPL
jgi:alpha-tubulin suppressor-like RCC1 family protein